jgi:hypothetical protein
VADLPMLARAIEPLQCASHVLVAHLPADQIPACVKPFLGAYAPILETHDGQHMWQRVGLLHKLVVADSHNSCIVTRFQTYDARVVSISRAHGAYA